MWLIERLCSPRSNAVCHAIQSTGSAADSEAGGTSEASIAGSPPSHQQVQAVSSLSGISSPPGNHCHSSPASSSHSPSSSLHFSNTYGTLYDKFIALRNVILEGDLWSESLVSPIQCLRNYNFVGEGIVLFEALLKVRALLGQTYSLRGVFDAS